MSQAATWRLPFDSGVVLGGDSANPDYDFADPGCFLFSDGRIAVVDGASDAPLKVYSASGKLLQRVRRGDGPGEVPAGGGAFVLSDDSVLVGFLSTNGQVQVLSPTLSEMRRAAPLALAPGGWVVDKLPDGRFVGVRRPPPDSSSRPQPNGLIEMDSEVIAWSADGKSVQSLFRFTEWIDYRAFRGVSYPRLFPYRFAHGLMYYSSNQRPVIEVRDVTGKVIRRFAVDLPVRVPTKGDVEAAIRSNVANYPESARDSVVKADYSEPYVPPALPFFRRFLVAHDGTLWAELFATVDHEGPQEYLVFSPAGKLMARASVPKGMTLVSVSLTSVAATSADDDGVVKVFAVPIRR